MSWWLIYGAGSPREPIGLHLVEAADEEEALRNHYVFGRLVRFDGPPGQTQPATWAAGPFDTAREALALEPLWAMERVLNLLVVRSQSGISSKAEETSGRGIAADSAAVSQSLSC